WDVSRRAEKGILKAHLAPVHTVAFSPDGKRLASGNGMVAEERGVVKLWDVTTIQELFSLELSPGLVQTVAYSPDGKTLACGLPGRIALVDTETGEDWAYWKLSRGELRTVAFCPDGRKLAWGGGVRECVGETGLVAVDISPEGVRTPAGHMGMVDGIA